MREEDVVDALPLVERVMCSGDCGVNVLGLLEASARAAFGDALVDFRAGIDFTSPRWGVQRPGDYD